MKSYTPKLKGDTCKVGAGGNKYSVGGKRVDEVVLRFDEDEQKFYARVVNPSQHTLYLFSQRRLGIALCHLNTGASLCYKTCSTVSKAQRKCHPRWTRCNNDFVPVTDIADEIVISYPPEVLAPQSTHCIRDITEIFYTKIKGLLLSLTSAYDDGYSPRGDGVYGDGASARGYKTYSNYIAIRVTGLEYITEYHSTGGDGQRKYRYDSLSVQQLDNTRYQITINNPNTALQDKIRQGEVYVSLEHNHLGKYVNGANAHQHYGDLDYPYQYLDENILQYIRYNSRWKFRINKSITGSSQDQEVMDSNSIIYELPQMISCHRLTRLERLIVKHGSESMNVIVAAPSICISVGSFRDSTFGCIGRVSINRQYQGFIDCNKGLIGEITLI